MSWWKRGHELGEQAGAGVPETARVPLPVVETTNLWAVDFVASVADEPIVGLAIVQSPVSLGHFELAADPVALIAARSSEAVPPTACSPGWPRTSATAGPVTNCRSLTGEGKPEWNWPE